MSKYKALKSFSGLVSMAAGDVKELTDPAAIKDLTRAGYIEEIKTTRRKTTKKDAE